CTPRWLGTSVATFGPARSAPTSCPTSPCAGAFDGGRRSGRPHVARGGPAPLADCYTISGASRSGAASRTGEPPEGGFLMRARLTAIALAVLMSGAPTLAQTSQRPIGDIEVFATLPYPGHPGGLAVDGHTLYVDTSNADFDRP